MRRQTQRVKRADRDALEILYNRKQDLLWDHTMPLKTWQRALHALMGAIHYISIRSKCTTV